jgi:thioesterase domain-containing protein/acyl carrier protein
MQQVATSTTIETLTRIWQRVLQLQEIKVDENFFDLGGDSALAVQLFADIAQTCGRQFPPVMIYHVPTIAEQAAMLDQPEATVVFPLVRLKAGLDDAPVFVAPGLGGGPAEFFQLVKFIETPRAMYGLQPQGFDGSEPPADTIEEMAAGYLQAIRSVQPHGPYSFVGYSLGGLVSLEMARTLLEQGERTSLLVMLDSYPHISSLTAAQQVRLLGIRARTRVSTVVHGQEVRRGGRAMDRTQIAAFAPAMETVKDCAYAALRRYRPEFYSGTVKFVRADVLSNFPEDPAVVWSHILPDLAIETAPGDHLGMLTTHYQALGPMLTRYISDEPRF